MIFTFSKLRTQAPRRLRDYVAQAVLAPPIFDLKRKSRLQLTVVITQPLEEDSLKGSGGRGHFRNVAEGQWPQASSTYLLVPQLLSNTITRGPTLTTCDVS